MAKKKFKVDILSRKSIEKLKKNILEYRDDLNRKMYVLCQRLAELGVDVAQANVVNLDAVFTGELFNSISSKEVLSTKQNVVFLVVADSEHAIYVEMGTGYIGAQTPYPGKLPAVYAQGKTIRKLADGRYGWFYNLDGQWYFTEGIPSRPFMWFASEEMQKQVVKIAREVFA